MSRPKLKVTKREEGWVVVLPPYGFNNARTLAGFRSHGEALRRARWLVDCAGGGVTTERAAAPRPVWVYPRTIGQPVIR